ncbi:SLD5 [Sanghuangporus sanghuang]
MTDSEGRLGQFSYEDTSDTYVSAGASSPAPGFGTRGAASSSSARSRPYPQRNGSESADDFPGQSRRKSGRRSRAGANGEPSMGGGYGDAMDVDAPRIPPGDLDFSSNERQRQINIHMLLRAWQNERHAPDILPVCDDLLTRTLDLIRSKTDISTTLRNADVTLSEEEHYCVTLLQTEVERIKFIIRSYVRTRLYKIEQHAAYITLNPDVHARLTKAELRHAQRYAELVASQFRTTVLDHLPEPQQDLDDAPTLTTPSMITSPDKNKPVFFRAVDTIEGLQLDDGTLASVPKDTIMLVPYRVIEQHVLRGEAELV